MSKPKRNTTVTAGTSVDKILTILLDGAFEARDFVHLSQQIAEKYNTTFNRRLLGEVVNGWNEGLYTWRGMTVDDAWRLCPIKKTKKKKTKKKKTKKHTELELELGFQNDEQHMGHDTLRDFEEHCRAEGIDPSETTGGWIKTENLSVRIKREVVDSQQEMARLIEVAKGKLDEVFYDTGGGHVVSNDEQHIGVVHISDLHIGAFVEGLLKTPDFNLKVLKDKLIDASDAINGFRFEGVHVQIYGDLIESFTGLNHPNSWKEMEQGIFGVEAVKIAVETLSTFFLDRIKNVVKVLVIGGNHDRVTSNNVEDSKGGVANLVAYCLDLKGYEVEFNPLVLTNTVGNIHYIMLHGDKGISKRGTKEIVWDYGIQGKFNFVLEGHLHNRIQKLTTKAVDKFQLVTDDTVDCRRQILPSVFTGNSYSNDNNWSANSGFVVTKDNGRGLPVVIDLPL